MEEIILLDIHKVLVQKQISHIKNISKTVDKYQLEQLLKEKVNYLNDFRISTSMNTYRRGIIS